MKKNNRMNIMIARAKRSALGRVFCRLAGDRAGAVMMEYVILGVLVAVAVVALVGVFGRGLGGGIGAMIEAVINPDGAATKQEDNRKRIKAEVPGAVEKMNQVGGVAGGAAPP